jgi:hypothetical protein
MKNLRRSVGIALTALLTLVLVLFAAPTGATTVVPVFVAGNPTCKDLGYAFGFKVDPPNAGTYNIDAFNTVTVTTDGVNFDWSSTLGMDAVISKGGPNANVYKYDPPAESFGDTGLHSPINPNNGNPFGLSHIEFCFDYELSISKTANTTFTRTFEWTIDKSVTPDTWELFTGDTGTSEYTVAVEKTGFTDSNWAVAGTITINNNTPIAATITGVSDQISGDGSPTPNCNVTFPYTLAAGGTLSCSYSSALPDGSSRTNTATVTTSGTVGGGSGTAPVTFGNPTTVVNNSINVDDTNGSSWEFSDSGSVSYSKIFTCDDDEGTHHNTATIVETDQSDDASVTVTCYELTVTKDADTSFTRSWDWTIDKSADQGNLLLSDGQLFLVNYEVTVDATSTDSDHAVSGNISVNNPAPMDATITSVSDIVSPDIGATVNCAVTFPYTLVAGGTLDCTYSADLPNATDRTNTATATLQNYDYDSDGNGTANGTTDFSGTASVDFDNADVTEIDECIEVSDTNVVVVLGTVCAADAPKTFTYSLEFGKNADADVQLECGDNTHHNVASAIANDTGTKDEDNWTVNATVACGQGCTLTQGYWKTHSDRGPAPYDDAWKNLGASEEDTFFFKSGKTWYQVFWTPPAGNAYYNLAHQYMAAKLNILNGASSTPAVDAAIAGAEALFNAQGVNDTTLSKAERTAALAYAATLDNYNNGLIGPGHCSE